MSLSDLIPSKPELSKGEDFEALLKDGIERIQTLSGKVWTDYNAHDPGITILEVLCYAITELTLKAKLDIQDILSSGLPSGKSGLYEAHEILPTTPTTLNDYRKLLIDVEGVNNGWLLPIPANEANGIHGIYDIYLELDDDEELGDLNSSIVERTVTISSQDYTLEFSFPYWDEELVSDFSADISINSIVSPGDTTVVLSTTNPLDQTDFFSNLEVTFNTIETSTFGITITVSPAIGSDPEITDDIKEEIITLLSEAPGGGPADTSVLKEFNRKVTAANVVKGEVVALVMQNRNLCEDFRNIKAIRIQEIAIYAHIKLLKKINIEKYLAGLYIELEDFFNSPLQKKSLNQLLEGGAPVESIFEGPLMEEGFIQDEVLDGQYNLRNDESKEVVFVSDLSHILTDTARSISEISESLTDNQVIAVERLAISNFIRNRVVQDKAKNCLALARPELFKPRFSRNKSRVNFLRQGTEVDFNADLVSIIHGELRMNRVREVDDNQVIEIEKGDSLEVAGFHSIQHDFPPLYGLANNNLPENTTSTMHKAQVEQLRAYLTTFDHVLAGYSNQIYHINELFSIDEDSENTYFKQTLYEIPHLRRILTGFLNSATTWETFVADLDNSYQNLLGTIYESPAVFLDRRNRFLDHILARYGMSLENYSMFRHSEEAKNVIESSELDMREEETAFDIIFDKTRILQRYPDLSKKRFNGFNYSVLSWNTQNISGLSHRLINLFGLKNTELRTRSTEPANYVQTNAIGGGFFDYQILDDTSSPVLHSSSTFPTEPEAREEALSVIQLGVARDNFRINEVIVGSGTRYEIVVEDSSLSSPTVLVSYTSLLENETLARRSIRKIIRGIKEIGTGVYIVEHMLLRPAGEDGLSTQELLIPYGNPPVPAADPYSFHISIVLPSGYSRDIINDGDPELYIPAFFRDAKFRSYAEGLIREEVPSHIIPHIFWLDFNTETDSDDTPSLQNFESAWRSWLEAKADSTTLPADLNDLRNSLVNIMNSMFQLS